jgi:hypothetical protein
MPEMLTCPGCQRKLQVPETLLGQNVQCPTCGATFRAQTEFGVSTAALPPVPREETAPSPEAPPPERRQLEDDDHDRDYGRDSRVRRRLRNDFEPHRGGLVLGLGIASLCVLVLGGLGPLIGLVLGPIAWVMGNADLTAIRAGRMDPEGENQTSTGRMLGMIATIVHAVLLVLGLVFCFVYIIFMAAVVGPSSSRNY